MTLILKLLGFLPWEWIVQVVVSLAKSKFQEDWEKVLLQSVSAIDSLHNAKTDSERKDALNEIGKIVQGK